MTLYPINEKTLQWCQYLLDKKDTQIHIVIGEFTKRNTGEKYQDIISYSWNYKDTLFLRTLPIEQISSQCVANLYEDYHKLGSNCSNQSL